MVHGDDGDVEHVLLDILFLEDFGRFFLDTRIFNPSKQHSVHQGAQSNDDADDTQRRACHHQGAQKHSSGKTKNLRCPAANRYFD